MCILTQHWRNIQQCWELLASNVASTLQQLVTMLGVVGQQCCVRLHEALKRLERLRFTFTANVNLYHVTKFSPNRSLLFIISTNKISSFTPVLYVTIVLNSFYLLIFYSEKFSTWIWRFPFSINLNVNLSIESHVYDKREFLPRDQVFQHQLFLHCLVEFILHLHAGQGCINLTHIYRETCALLFITSILKLVTSR